MKAVRLNGTDVTDTGIEVRPNEDVSGVEIELTTQVSELSGMVADARGQTVKDYSVVVFARDSARWTFGSRYFGGRPPDQDGRFKVRNLPPGDYYAIALDYVEPGAGTDPEFLEKIRDRATPFSMTEGRHQDARSESGPRVVEPPGSAVDLNPTVLGRLLLDGASVSCLTALAGDLLRLRSLRPPDPDRNGDGPIRSR